MITVTNDKSISFWHFITNVSKIEIPIIQRDYAQGRSDVKASKIRTLFLDSLINSIEKNEVLELDFVYGNIDSDVFQPLDGQQRLTTLFLLHWYIALRIGQMPNAKHHLQKFTYETRITSREFCNELSEKFEFLGEGQCISEKIADSGWFFLSWKKDPTIKAMLVMLDNIESKLKDKTQSKLKDSWLRLTSENSPITFHFTKLIDIGLTDDLYIKMNARGVPLTDFENFKARFEKHIEKNKWEVDVNAIDTFSHKIDTFWIDLFWKHRGDDNQIDNELIKFVAGIAINNYAEKLEIYSDAESELLTRKNLEEKSKAKLTNEAIRRERIERRIAILSNNPTEVSPEDFPSKESFNYLKYCFDIYTENSNDELMPQNLPLWDFVEEKSVRINWDKELSNNLFIEFVKNSETTYKQRVLFYAQTQYLLCVETIDSSSFSEWMRVVRNVVQNATIDSAATYIGAMGLVKEISKGSMGIYSYLNNQGQNLPSFAKDQMLEEILKASIIQNQSEAKGVIFSTEDTSFFKGKISFALYCVDCNEINRPLDSRKLELICKVVKDYLSFTDISNDFRRAFLTIRNNDFYEYWKSWSYGTNSHKRCLIENVADLKNNFTSGEYRVYLKDILWKLVDNSLENIISDYNIPENMPNWKHQLIKNPNLLNKYCQSHYFGISNDNSRCYLFRDKKRPSSQQECKEIK